MASIQTHALHVMHAMVFEASADSRLTSLVHKTSFVTCTVFFFRSDFVLIWFSLPFVSTTATYRENIIETIKNAHVLWIAVFLRFRVGCTDQAFHIREYRGCLKCESY